MTRFFLVFDQQKSHGCSSFVATDKCDDDGDFIALLPTAADILLTFLSACARKEIDEDEERYIAKYQSADNQGKIGLSDGLHFWYNNFLFLSDLARNGGYPC
jgi:hypothetical protein